MLARNVKQETAEIKRSLFLSLSLFPLHSFVSCIRPLDVVVPAAVLILLVTFFTCEQVSDLRANLSTSRGDRGQASRQAGRQEGQAGP